MTEPYYHISLPNRNFITVTGEDSESFLQGLLTIDTIKIADNQLYPAALLTPQGKIAYSFLLGKINNGFLIDIDEVSSAEFCKKLAMYKLRSRISINLTEKQYCYGVITNSDTLIEVNENIFLDKSFTNNNVYRFYQLPPEGSTEQSFDYWKSLMILSGIASINLDYNPLELFPHDINLDQMKAVDFRKGCYIGQEVTARIQHKTKPRKRLLIAKIAENIPFGRHDIYLGNKTIGFLNYYLPNLALAVMRIDKLAQAYEENQKPLIDGKEVSFELPPYANFEIVKSNNDE